MAFYKGAECCLLVYDITNPRSFTTLLNWKTEFLRQAAPKNLEAFPFILLGNKADKESERKVPADKAAAWCKANGDIPCFETSAKDQTNVTEAFEKAAKMAMQNQKNTQPLVQLGQGSRKLTATTSKQKGCC